MIDLALIQNLTQKIADQNLYLTLPNKSDDSTHLLPVCGLVRTEEVIARLTKYLGSKPMDERFLAHDVWYLLIDGQSVIICIPLTASSVKYQNDCLTCGVLELLPWVGETVGEVEGTDLFTILALNEGILFLAKNQTQILFDTQSNRFKTPDQQAEDVWQAYWSALDIFAIHNITNDYENVAVVIDELQQYRSLDFRKYPPLPGECFFPYFDASLQDIDPLWKDNVAEFFIILKAALIGQKI